MIIESFLNMFPFRHSDETETKSVRTRKQRKSSDSPYAKKTFAQASQRFMNSVEPKTRQNYVSALVSLKKFNGGKDMLLSSVTARKMAMYERWLKSRGICNNTISCYMRSLRALYNKIGSFPYRPKEHPFKKVFTGKVRTRKLCMSDEDLSKMVHLQVPDDSPLKLAHDLFLFSLYAMGMPFVDMAYLRQSDICGDTIYYERRKTRQLVVVRIEPCMREILDRYKYVDTGYVFPLLQPKLHVSLSQQYTRRVNAYNRGLNVLAMMAGVRMRLSSYVARHTWASVACQNNVNLAVISRALGHTNLSTTQVYIADVSNHKLAAANRKVISHIKERRHFDMEAAERILRERGVLL